MRFTHPQLGQYSDGVRATVLGQRPRDDLQGVAHGTERPLLHTLDGLGLLGQGCQGTSVAQGTGLRCGARGASKGWDPNHGRSPRTSDEPRVRGGGGQRKPCKRGIRAQPPTRRRRPPRTNRQRHLRGTATGQQLGLKHDVAGHLHGVLQVALHLVQEVLATTPQQDGACLGAVTLLQERKVPEAQRQSEGRGAWGWREGEGGGARREKRECRGAPATQGGSASRARGATHSSPNFRISNKPQPVPMSLSCSSSVRDTMVAPHTRAMRLLSVLRMRRMAEMLAFSRKC
jgi:hypothetical protein